MLYAGVEGGWGWMRCECGAEMRRGTDED